MAGGVELFEGFVKLRADDRELMTGQLPGIARNIGALLAGAAVVKIAVDGLDELKEQQDVLTKTDATLKATGESASGLGDHIGQLAEQMQELTGKDKEAVQAGENILLQFRNVRNEVGEGNDIFDRATKDAVDLAVATGQDLSGAFRTLGRALEDPVQGSRALRAANVILTESEKEHIKTLQDQGQTLEAQRFILDKLEHQVGGLGEAYGQTLAGQMERAKNVMDDAKASIVAGLVPAMEVGGRVALEFAQGVQALPQPLQTTVGLVTAAAIGWRVLNPLLESGAGLFRRTGEGAEEAGRGLSSATFKAGAAVVAVTGLIAAWGEWDRMNRDTAESTKAVVAALNERIDTSGLDHARDSIANYNTQIDKLKEGLQFSFNPLEAASRAAQYGNVQDQIRALEESKKRTEELIERTNELMRTQGLSADAAYAQAVAEKGSAEAKTDATKASKLAADAEKDQAETTKTLTAAMERERDITKATTDELEKQYKLRVDLGQVNLDYAKSQIETNKTQADVLEKLRSGKLSADEQKLAVIELTEAFRRQADAAVNEAEKQAEANGKTLDGKQKAELYRTELEKLEAKVPGLRSQIQGFVGDLNQVPDQKTVDLSVRISATASDALSQALVGAFTAPSLGGQLSQADQDAIRKGVQSILGGTTHQGGGHMRAGEIGTANLRGKGEEVFVPDVPGSVLPSGMAGSEAAPGFVHNGDVIVNVPPGASPEQYTSAVMRAHRTAAFLGGVN